MVSPFGDLYLGGVYPRIFYRQSFDLLRAEPCTDKAGYDFGFQVTPSAWRHGTGSTNRGVSWFVDPGSSVGPMQCGFTSVGPVFLAIPGRHFYRLQNLSGREKVEHSP